MIPHDMGTQAIFDTLKETQKYTTDFIHFNLLVLEFLLTHNFSHFNGVYYLQRCGTTMGTSFGPTYANLYMGRWEQCHVYGCDYPYWEHIVWYGRYIDDLFIWQGPQEGITELHKQLNNNDYNLQLALEHHKGEINFLDLTLKGNSHTGKIDTHVYRKPTAGNMILRYNSCHPKHTVNSIPYGQFTRYRRNCSSEEAYIEQSKQLGDRLCSQGYSRELITTAHEKVNKNINI